LKFVHRNHRAGIQIIRTLFQNPLEQFTELLRAQSFNAYSDHRRLEGLRQRKVHVEISIERDNHSILKGRSANDFRIFRLGQTDFARVNRIEACATKNRCRRTRSSLVRAAISSSRGQINHPVVQAGRGVGKRLADVFLFQFGKLALQIPAIGISGDSLHHAAHRQTQLADARLTVILFGSKVMRLKIT